MTSAIILAAIVLGVVALCVAVLWRSMSTAYREAQAQAAAASEKVNADRQEEYAKIATRGSDEQRAGRMLDDGRF